VSLTERLQAQPAADEPKYTPRTEFDGCSGFIQTGPLTEQPADFTALLREFGYDPDAVCISGHPRISRWQQRARNRETNEFETVWLAAYRFNLASICLNVSADIQAIVKAARVERRPGNGPHWLVFQAGDLQIGKRSRDGSTEEILKRYVQSVESACTEFASLKRLGIEGIQICMPGDCIEGNQSQKGQNLWLTQETITEQVLIFQRLVMLTIEAFAPLTERVFVDVVNGNHDEAQRQQNTYPGNGWATTAATMTSDVLKQNPLAFGHVEVRVPPKWQGHMTVPVGDTVVTVIHGHQWRRRERAMNWWAEQSVHNQPPGAAQVLQAGHYHTWALEGHATKTVVYSPTFDLGSDWYREQHGAESRRGALVYLMRSGEITRISVV
jgi:hypothetical protein